MMNINSKKTKSLCTQCGTCLSLCPKENIKISRDSDMNYVFDVIDEEKCQDCGICLEVCPAIEVDFKKLEKATSENLLNNVFIGRYSSIYLAEAEDPAIRDKAASGGAVSAILGFLFDKGIIEAAILAKPSVNPYEPEVFLARKREDVPTGSGSMYYPVPVNTALKKALKEEGQIAIVGLPCHIAALRKAEEAGVIAKGKIAFKLGLFCGWNTSFSILDFLIRRAGIKDMKTVNKIRFRQCNWPGYIHIELKDGHTIELPGEYRDFVSHIYLPRRCSLCPDQMNELADVSFGDAWLVARESGNFDSIVVSRDQRIDRLLEGAASEKYIRLKPIEEKDTISSQLAPLLFKKRGITARIRMNRVFDVEVPSYPSYVTLDVEGKRLKPDILDYIGALILMAISAIVKGNKKAKRLVNDILPLSIIKFYAFLERNLLTHHNLGKKLLKKIGLAR